jgi:SAM-dependent methyltransferase
VLSNPAVYNATQRAFGAGAARRDVAARYLQARSKDRVLDIGCGTAEILPYLPASVDYWGFDLSDDYIREAQERFGDRGHFRCADVGEYVDHDNLRDMDLVLASGVLHHLDDPESQSLISLASRVLRPGGRLVTVDPTFAPGQSRASRWLVSKDRGQSVRTPEGYRSLAAAEFGRVDVHVRHDMLRIPYSHCVLVCTK